MFSPTSCRPPTGGRGCGSRNTLIKTTDSSTETNMVEIFATVCNLLGPLVGSITVTTVRGDAIQYCACLEILHDTDSLDPGLDDVNINQLIKRAFYCLNVLRRYSEGET